MAVTSERGYKDGVSVVNIASNNFIGANSIYLMARNADGLATSVFSGKIQAVAIYNTTISASQILALTNAMNAL